MIEFIKPTRRRKRRPIILAALFVIAVAVAFVVFGRTEARAQDGEPMHAIGPGLEGAVVLVATPYHLAVMDAGDVIGDGSTSRFPMRYYPRTIVGLVSPEGVTVFYQSSVNDYEANCLNSHVRITGSRFVGFAGETHELGVSDFERTWRRVWSDGEDEASRAFQVACENIWPRGAARAATVDELVARYYDLMDERNFEEAERGRP